MKRFAKAGSRTGIVLSLTAAAMFMPEVILAGPGCMNNQRMAPGYYPGSPMEIKWSMGRGRHIPITRHRFRMRG